MTLKNSFYFILLQRTHILASSERQELKRTRIFQAFIFFQKEVIKVRSVLIFLAKFLKEKCSIFCEKGKSLFFIQMIK